MNTMQVTCGNCSGTGTSFKYLIVRNNDGTETTKSEYGYCKKCGGKGYTEYAVFSPEEAKAILKHCGLSTES